MATTEDSKRVLIVDDEEPIREMLQCFLETKGYRAQAAPGGREALMLIDEEQPHLVFLDVRMPEMDGLEALGRIRRAHGQVPVVIMTGYGSVDSAVTAMKMGASDFISKPVKLAELLRVVEETLSGRGGGAPPARGAVAAESRALLPEAMGHSPQIRKVCHLVEQVAATDLTVLIYGETGSGKSLVAAAIHAASHRVAKRLVRVDCGAIPDTLIESELFGHERGAFTGADHRNVGYFESANGGTLFLDEIANLSEAMMRKLLCALEDRQIYRVGGKEPIDVDIRVVAASNQSLERLVEQGQFRRDLLHRINEFVIEIPPLRDRREDIPFLVQRFVTLTCTELGKDVRGASPEAMTLLKAHHWPGNVRQLRNVIRRAVLLCDDAIEPEHLRAASMNGAHDEPPGLSTAALDRVIEGDWSLRDITRECVRQVEATIIGAVLERTGGNKSQAARMLNCDYKTLFYKAKDLGY